MKRGQLEQFIYKIRASGRYCFSWDEIRQGMTDSDDALRQALFRLKQKNLIAQVRKNFYVIVSPEYSAHGQLPPHLFIDDMMKWMERPYYVGLLSAAALYGAAHQQPMHYYVITRPPALRSIKNGGLSIDFFVKNQWSSRDVEEHKTDAGYMTVSIPEITALDLLTYGNFGISRVYNILEELSEKMKKSTLTRVAKDYHPVSSVQRLGYLLDKELGKKDFGIALQRGIKDRKKHYLALQKNSHREGAKDHDWKIFKNTNIESDL